jgi:hypothetical protein
MPTFFSTAISMIRFTAQTHRFVIGTASAAPKTVRGEGREPDHFEIGVLQADAHVFGPHAETHADAAVDFDAMGQLPAAIMSSICLCVRYAEVALMFQ